MPVVQPSDDSIPQQEQEQHAATLVPKPKSYTLRIPKFAAAAAMEDLPDTVRNLPDSDQRERNFWYGIRCSDMWQDVDALILGEQGFPSLP
jgi:hypothetical protein